MELAPPVLQSLSRFSLGVVLCVVLTSCSQVIKPDLVRLYRSTAESPDTTPVILIPGLFGSKLRDRGTGREVWPGEFSDVVFSDYSNLALHFDSQTLQVLPDNLEAFDIAEQVIGQDFYRPIIDTLQKAGGYVRGTPGTSAVISSGGHQRRYYIFAYDWRQDNVQHAAALDKLIEAIRRDYNDPALKVDIVAHSMGGLIARYYLRYGTEDALDSMGNSLVTLYGTTRVRKLILLGTPNMGSVSSLHAFLQGERIGLKSIPPEVLATMPSGYQLFPHPLVTWLIDTKGEALDMNLFDGATWRKLGWSIFDPATAARMKAGGIASESTALQKYFDFRLERGRRFMWMLSTPEPATPIRYVLFGGDCTLTPARLALEDENGHPTVRLNPGDIRSPVAGVRYNELMLEPGDGRVTKPSLLARENLDPSAPQSEDSFIPIAYWFFLCERHDQLTNNVNFQDNLLNVLLTRSLPWEMQATPKP